jgi:hypothetical protein
MNDSISQTKSIDKVPIRGSLRLSVTTSSPKVIAGTDFSIFTVIQNPFDVPITVYQVQTHIPIELIDVNGLRIRQALRREENSNKSFLRKMIDSIIHYFEDRAIHSGIAIAVGTDFDPNALSNIFDTRVMMQDVRVAENLTVAGMQLIFPENPSSDELDRIFRRTFDYKKGIIPITLQPGDSIVRQFVLRTRHWLFFTPLSHTFQIQANYSSDAVDHSDTVSYQQSVQSTLGAITIGAMVGAIVGTLLKFLTSSQPPGGEASLVTTLAASLLASVAVVIAFARRTTAQSIISVEDFWGGALIGFTTGFFGFEQFFNLFSTAPTP